jgi:hypothetical protein
MRCVRVINLLIILISLSREEREEGALRYWKTLLYRPYAPDDLCPRLLKKMHFYWSYISGMIVN